MTANKDCNVSDLFLHDGVFNNIQVTLTLKESCFKETDDWGARYYGFTLRGQRMMTISRRVSFFLDKLEAISDLDDMLKWDEIDYVTIDLNGEWIRQHSLKKRKKD